jgi:isopenicillin-N epimerase
MSLRRRDFLTRTGLVLAGGAVGPACDGDMASLDPDVPPHVLAGTNNNDRWAEVRNQFSLTGEYIHMSAMLISSHPRPVREAIEEYRRGLDENPALYLGQNNGPRREAVRAAAGRYLAVDAAEIALTDSTTMGIGLVYNGLRLQQEQEILTTEEDYFVTHESVRQITERTGATERRIAIFEDISNVSADEIVERISDEIRPETRVLGLTWVHSSTGLKLPLARIAEAVQEANRGRDEDARVLICVDGVHGFGIEDVTMGDLGCDFFVAGCHTWLFGPRGTGLVWARASAWALTIPSIPSFIDDGTWDAWLNGSDLRAPTDADRMTPGGFKAFEHQWAVEQAFEFHQQIGKARVAERTHELATQLKEGLAGMAHVQLITPMSPDLSSGIVSFDVAGMNPREAVRRLRARRIVASVAPYATPHARLTPSIRNTPEEIDIALQEIRGLAEG